MVSARHLTWVTQSIPRPTRRQGTPWWETVCLPRMSQGNLSCVLGCASHFHPGRSGLCPGWVLWVLLLCIKPTSCSYWAARDVGPWAWQHIWVHVLPLPLSQQSTVSTGFLIFKIGIVKKKKKRNCDHLLANFLWILLTFLYYWPSHQKYLILTESLVSSSRLGSFCVRSY